MGQIKNIKLHIVTDIKVQPHTFHPLFSSHKPVTMAEEHKIFVGKLSWNATQEYLESFFGKFGEVKSSYIPKDRETGRPRGFAFVEFATEDGVQNAIKNGDGEEIDGRTIVVNKANQRGGGGGGGGGFWWKWLVVRLHNTMIFYFVHFFTFCKRLDLDFER